MCQRGLGLKLDNLFNRKGAVSLGAMSNFKPLAGILASGASNRAWNGLIFGKSVPFMHFGAHKNFQLPQITLLLSNDYFITLNDNHHDDKVIPHWTFFCDYQYAHWRTLTKFQPVQCTMRGSGDKDVF